MYFRILFRIHLVYMFFYSYVMYDNLIKVILNYFYSLQWDS